MGTPLSIQTKFSSPKVALNSVEVNRNLGDS
ncbi:uncharacterized protein METZ01_LOCUS215796 [marine metagenome]|uniref:Uncharacterized protein n=1 Tax=marine metagenome TaxID=408172 RepID=A0A382FJX9_9ZZZZ